MTQRAAGSGQRAEVVRLLGVPETSVDDGAPAAAGERPPRRASGAVRLETRQLSVHFGERWALECVDARFSQGETVGLLGPNGAGKSTLLRSLAGMQPPSHGEVRLDGAPVRRPGANVIYVPQRTGVDWHFPVSVLDVALMGRARRVSRLAPFGRGDRAAALAALDRVGMRELAAVQIGQLSGGQQQRVFLARALLQDGEVLLLDEPFAGVDVPTQELLVALFGRLRDAGKTILYATHDFAQAAASDRVLLLNRRLVAAGPPRAVLTPANLAAAFGGQAMVPFAGAVAP
ncbi:MAG: metal ABC transporter ATP-binding protein [Chloroflexota bacterium]|nr:metal ABC transporter ATP-binding protein [Chloroflexota bacterium]